MMENDMQKECRVAIYVRESRDDNEENIETIENQRDMLVKYVETNQLGSIVDVYADDNTSGSVFERNGLDRLKNDVRNGGIDLILVKDLSRLGRNNARTLLFLDFLEEYGVRVLSSDGRYDSRRNNDTVGIETWFNERYVRDISRKIRASLRFKIEKGEYLGHAPYGFRKSSRERNRLCIEESEADVVRLIFRLYRAGYGYASIARILDDRGFVSPGGGTWNQTGVRRILCNRVYTGDTVQGISEKISFKSKKTRRLPEDRWVITQDTHEAIVSKDEFEEVQRIRMGKSKPNIPHKRIIHPLRGLLFCGRCGSIMYVRSRGRGWTAYVCSRYYKNGNMGCSSHFVHEGIILDYIIKEFAVLMRNSDIIAGLERRFINSGLFRDNTKNRMEKMKQQLDARLKQQEILYQDRLEGDISMQLFSRMNRQMDERICKLRQEIKSLAGMKKPVPDVMSCLSRIREEMEHGHITNEIVKLIVKRVTVYEPCDVYRCKPPGNKISGGRGLIVIDFRHESSIILSNG